MSSRQFRVLYRDFLFGIVDRELLSTYATGDASQLLLQIVALLIFLSVCCSVPALAQNATAPAQARLMFALTIEHFLIATTMLVVGLFAVLSWDAMFPGHRDVLVLAPLPIRAHTILLAKLAAVATALGLALAALHIVSGMVWPLALNAADVTNADSGARTWIRLLTAYWLTMIAAGVFTFGLAMSAQGIAASLLPRRHFLRVSSWLQLGAFCLIVSMYFLQPITVRPGAILAAQQRGLLASPPSYWFLGLFQQLSGSPALAPLARSAWMGLGLAILGTVIAYALSYLRTLRRIAEEPDGAPVVSCVRWLPAFGDAVHTAVVQFSIRTLFRSAQHRVILAFYWGMGFAFTLIFLKSPRGQQLTAVSVVNRWQETSVPLLVSSILMAGGAVLAARLAFAMPRDLRANWIFRLLSVGGGPRYVAARRRALIVTSAAPVWTASAIVFLWMWPWRPAAGHLVALALLSLMLVEIALYGAQKIPFTCSYLPGRSYLHLAVCVAILVLLPLTIMAATFERDALQDPLRYAALVAVLALAWFGLRWRTAVLGIATGGQPEFEDEPTGRVVTLDLWDSRFARSSAGRTPTHPPYERASDATANTRASG